MSECLFCDIIKKEEPASVIYEDNRVLVILDINPVNKGHLVLMPKKHFKNIYDVQEDVLQDMIEVSKKMAVLLKERLGADGVNIISNNNREAGQMIDHIHFNIIPRYKNDEVIDWKGTPYQEGEFEEMAKRLT